MPRLARASGLVLCGAAAVAVIGTRHRPGSARPAPPAVVEYHIPTPGAFPLGRIDVAVAR